MRVLVCGGRSFDDWALFTQEMDKIIPKNAKGEQDYEQLLILQGGASGADFLAKVWAKWMYVPYIEYPANWKDLGKAAGNIRNQVMLTEGKPDLVIAFPGGKGTANMVKIAKDAGIEVKEITIAIA